MIGRRLSRRSVLAASVAMMAAGRAAAMAASSVSRTGATPMRHHRIAANGINLNVAELGSGPPVLFCHGFPAIAASWAAQMTAVAQAGYRALAPDMRGYGDSDAPRDAEAYMPFHTV